MKTQVQILALNCKHLQSSLFVSHFLCVWQSVSVHFDPVSEQLLKEEDVKNL